MTDQEMVDQWLEWSSDFPNEASNLCGPGFYRGYTSGLDRVVILNIWDAAMRAGLLEWSDPYHWVYEEQEPVTLDPDTGQWFDDYSGAEIAEDDVCRDHILTDAGADAIRRIRVAKAWQLRPEALVELAERYGVAPCWAWDSENPAFQGVLYANGGVGILGLTVSITASSDRLLLHPWQPEPPEVPQPVDEGGG